MRLIICIGLSFICFVPVLKRAQTVTDGARGYFKEAREAESRSDWQAAETNYLKAIAISPGWAEAVVNLGIVYNRQGKPDLAARAFTRAAEINPQLLGAHLNLAITYFRARRFGEAEAPLRRA